MFHIGWNMIVSSLGYLEIYDIFAFMRTDKKNFNNKHIEKLFISLYYNPDMLFVALCNNCTEVNKRALFINLCREKRLFKNFIMNRLIEDKDIELTNKLIAIGGTRDCIQERKTFMNLREKKLKNVHWIWNNLISLRIMPLSLEYQMNIKEIPIDNIGGSINMGPYNGGSNAIMIGTNSANIFGSDNIISLGVNAYATEDDQLVLASYSAPLKLIDDKYISVMVNGRKGRLPIIFDD